MDWKKEKISASELERRQKEYASAALAMMRSAHPATQKDVLPAGTEAESKAEEVLPENEPVVEITAKAEIGAQITVTAPAENSAEDDGVHEPAEMSTDEASAELSGSGGDTSGTGYETTDSTAPEEVSAVEPNDETDRTVPEEHLDPEEKDDRYGVYTADELMSGDYSGDGLKKAAEILEEMTRNTKMMKELAESDSDPDTTDFPDFSCDNGNGGQFRGEEDAQTEEQNSGSGNVG